ncbi:MAG: hypothetical protein LBR22_06135 [Desulfovibrio sp.]|nr:hypothetical protein [Desulfovibrio sp.]
MNDMKRDLSPNPVQDVADFFLVNADPESPITAPKLQNLCAYAQAYSLAFNWVRLFDSDIEEYSNGPVVRELLDRYQDYGQAPIPPPPGIDRHSIRGRFSLEQRFPLDIVNLCYGDFSPDRLAEESRKDFPGTWAKSPTLTPIPDAKIRACFRKHSSVVAVHEGMTAQ